MRTGLRRMAHRLREHRARVHPRPLLVLGNQKSGTTAVAGLLAHALGWRATLDIRGIHGDAQRRLHAGELSLADFVEANRLAFSRPLVKEPALTFLLDPLVECFPDSPIVFVVRDPRSNIRSILNRLGLPGDREALDAAALERAGRAGPNWRRMLEPGAWCGAHSEHYVLRLAERWRRAAELLLEHRDRLVPVRYEDFLADREGVIAELADRLGLTPRRRLGERAFHAFQRPGCPAPPQLFFGPRNLARILDCCAEPMRALGYGALAPGGAAHVGA